MDEDLEKIADKLSEDEQPTARAIKSLIEVKDHKKGTASEIELKTDITEDEQKIQSVLSVISEIISNKDSLKDDCILSPVIMKLQRLALSKNRKSRAEIVAVARQPDMSMGMMDGGQNDGFVRRLMTSRKNRGF